MSSDLVRWMANFVNLSTPLGLVVAVLGRAEVRPGPGGLLLAERYRLRFPVAGAFTVGNVVLTTGDFQNLLRGNPRLLRHEGRHAWQYAACAGVPFLPLYAAAALVSWALSGDTAAYNAFERDAGLTSGGYRHQAVRWNAPGAGHR